MSPLREINSPGKLDRNNLIFFSISLIKQSRKHKFHYSSIKRLVEYRIKNHYKILMLRFYVKGIFSFWKYSSPHAKYY